jgi:hypothetical protein
MVQYLAVPLSMTMGILCMVTVYRRRSYRSKGLVDPLRKPLLTAVVVLGAFAAVLFILLTIHMARM